MEFPRTSLRCSVQIDLYALERNLGRIRDFLPHSKSYIALVAANAFGIGMEAAVARLMLSGADAFAVANLSEAVRVRKVGPGWGVIVLSASIPGEEDFFIEHDITPTLASLEEIERFEAAAKRLQKSLKVHMRLPSKPLETSIPDSNQALLMLEKLLDSENLELEAFCLSGTGTGATEDAVECDGDFLKKAAKILKAENKSVYIHHSDIFDPASVPDFFETSLRAGLVLFGIKPEKGSVLAGFEPEQVITFRSAVSHIKRLPKGAFVGYCKTYQLKRDSRIALISVGYGDGLARSAGGNESVIVRDKLLPIIGIVSMDQAAIDATELPQIQLSDEVIIIGHSQTQKISIEDYCKHLKISAAEALTSITQRVTKFYAKGSNP